MERQAPRSTVNGTQTQGNGELVAQLRALQAQVAGIGHPSRSDLVGRELDVIDHALRRLLRELGERDQVD